VSLDAVLPFLSKLFPEGYKICIDGFETFLVLDGQCGVKRCTLTADRCKSCPHLGRIDAVLVENTDHAIRPLDIQVKMLQSVLVMVCPEIILEPLIDGRYLPGSCLSIRSAAAGSTSIPRRQKARNVLFIIVFEFMFFLRDFRAVVPTLITCCSEELIYS